MSGSSMNVFEWCWEHGPDNEEDRETLLRLAFKAIGEPQPSLHPVMLSGSDPYSVGRLVSADFLCFDHEDQGVGFPAYEAWLTEHEVTR